VVNSLLDVETPPDNVVTLRAALARLDDYGTIVFDPSLDNGTIELSIVGEAHSILYGEVFTMSAGRWVFQGFQERDYGASALYAEKNVTIDASGLPHGITLRWAGGDANRARVLGVLGDLSLNNVTILDGFSSSVALAGNATQPWTLARGGAVACWGSAIYDNCTFGGNRVLGDNNASRDRGAFGGAVYGDLILMDNCVVAGNRAEGYGGAGGGVYSVGGQAAYNSLGCSSVSNSSITGNRVTAQHAYGGGIYTDGGGLLLGGSANMYPLKLTNCTIARNRVEDNPAIAESNMAQYYYRGGGIYMSNGWLELASCTVAENEVDGIYHLFSNKPNIGGGGIAATIGNAHDVEDMGIWHSVIVGNKLNGADEDIFTGSLVHFYSMGYNRIGKIDFTYMLAPVPWWDCLNRRHWPKPGDADGVTVAGTLQVENARRHPSILSAGADTGERAILWYPPADSLVDQVPSYPYAMDHVYVSFYDYADNNAPMIDAVLARLRERLGDDFGATLPDHSALGFYGPAYTWPSDSANAPWIDYWHAVDNEIGSRLGQVGMGEEFWGSLVSSPLTEGFGLTVTNYAGYYPSTVPAVLDARGVSRLTGERGDIGAIERSSSDPADPAPAAAPASSGGCTTVPGGGSSSALPLAALACAALVRRVLRPKRA
jgi:hypothetical protein